MMYLVSCHRLSSNPQIHKWYHSSMTALDNSCNMSVSIAETPCLAFYSSDAFPSWISAQFAASLMKAGPHKIRSTAFLSITILFSPPHSPVGVRWTGPDWTGLTGLRQICAKLAMSPPDWTGLLLKFPCQNRILDLTRPQSSLPSPVDSSGLVSLPDWTGLYWTMKKLKICPDQINDKTYVLRRK